MHDQPTSSPGERMDRSDSSLLAMLTLDETHRPWAVVEIARETENDPTDALGRPHRDGLIHRLGDFVWATRPAVRSCELRDA
jgi:hypothetical protein